MRLVSEIQVQCKVCKLQLNYEHYIEYAASCSLHPISHPTQSDKTVTSTTVEAALEDLKQWKSSASVDRLCTLWMKNQLRSSEDGKTVQLKTGGRVSLHYSISQAKLFHKKKFSELRFYILFFSIAPADGLSSTSPKIY